MPKLLFLVSSARELPLADGRRHETGYFADETLTPYERFVAAGVDVVVVTADGKVPYADPYGLEPIFYYPDDDKDFLNGIVRTFARDADDIRMTLHQLTELGLIAARRIYLRLTAAGLTPAEARKIVAASAFEAWRKNELFIDILMQQRVPPGVTRADLEADLSAVVAESRAESKRVKDTLDSLPSFLKPVNLADMSDATMATFDAVFVPGGHGPMVDLADNPDVMRMIRILHAKRATIASLCHGPAFLLAAPPSHDGTWLFDGYRITAFTDEEELQTPPGKEGMAWFLELALRNAGAVFDDGRLAWASNIVVDRNLITGQNPDLVEAVAEAVLKALNVGMEKAA